MTAVVLRGDARALPLPDASVDLLVTSPPYFGLRSYTDGGEHYSGQIGSEATPTEWLAAMVECTAEWMRVLKPSGSIFVNLGDKYNSAASGQKGSTSVYNGSDPETNKWANDYRIKQRGNVVPGFAPKSLMGLPWRYAIACTDQLGLILRRDIIWSKPNGLPESVTDRCRSSHEYVFHLVKQPRYYAAIDEIREASSTAATDKRSDPSRHAAMLGTSYHDHVGDAERGNRAPLKAFNPLGKLPGSVWDIPSQPLTVPPELGIDHFAAFPMELPRRIILGWSPPGICVACGEGRRPVVTAERIGNGRLWGRGGRGPVDTITQRRHEERTERQHTGYACACPEPTAPTRPALVVDPFGGTGTTSLVAAMHGRHGVSVDMSADYCRLAAWRTTDPAERAKALGVAKPPPIPDGMEPLFSM